MDVAVLVSGSLKHHFYLIFRSSAAANGLQQCVDLSRIHGRHPFVVPAIRDHLSVDPAGFKPLDQDSLLIIPRRDVDLTAVQFLDLPTCQLGVVLFYIQSIGILS